MVFFKFLLTIVIGLSISFILCKMFNLVLVYFIAWPPVNRFSLTEGLPCLKIENEMNLFYQHPRLGSLLFHEFVLFYFFSLFFQFILSGFVRISIY